MGIHHWPSLYPHEHPSVFQLLRWCWIQQPAWVAIFLKIFILSGNQEFKNIGIT
jgi:hypothetical protein